MNSTNLAVGQLGQELAEAYLVQKGYQMRERNYRTKYGEIDLILTDGETLVFVEVKTKRGGNFGQPEEMFTVTKSARVRRMAEVFLEGQEVVCRIDMVAVVMDKNLLPVRIQHYENVG